MIEQLKVRLIQKKNFYAASKVIKCYELIKLSAIDIVNTHILIGKQLHGYL